jgi:hypothetical protein
MIEKGEGLARLGEARDLEPGEALEPMSRLPPAPHPALRAPGAGGLGASRTACSLLSQGVVGCLLRGGRCLLGVNLRPSESDLFAKKVHRDGGLIWYIAG